VGRGALEQMYVHPHREYFEEDMCCWTEVMMNRVTAGTVHELNEQPMQFQKHYISLHVVYVLDHM
jgi:hypothetical protein